MDLSPNAVVAGRFRLRRLLGQGGMGQVWEAEHLGLGVACAVKFLLGEIAQLDEARARFEREAKAAAQIRSPNVVQTLDYGTCDGTPYIAMEMLVGEDLAHRLQREGPLLPRELHLVIDQVCRALARAHALGIVHRDLKPDNIFLTREEDGLVAKVLDFGIAKAASHQLAAGSATRTGTVMGTPYYMSPEQAKGAKNVDARSDLWSMAVIAFECLTGRLPFDSESLAELIVKILVEPLPVPSQIARVPPGFDAWWARAASREPDQRFQDARAFVDSLGQALDVRTRSGGHPRASTSSPPVHAPPAVERPRASTTPIGMTPPGSMRSPPQGTASLTPPGFIARTPTPQGQADAEAMPALPMRRSAPVAIAGAGILLAGLAIGAAVVAVRHRAQAAAAASVVQSAPSSAPPAPSASVVASSAPVASFPQAPVMATMPPPPRRPGRPAGTPPAASKPPASRVGF